MNRPASAQAEQSTQDREATFNRLYGFMEAAASVQSLSRKPEEAIAGKRLQDFLNANREAAKKQVMAP